MSSEAILRPNLFSVIPEHWMWQRLDQVCDGIFDCPHSTPQLSKDGPYVVRSQDIRTGFFKMDQAARVSEQTYKERIARAEPTYGDLFFSREGTYFGIAAEVPPNTKVCLGQRMVLLRPKSAVLNFRFLRYWLNSQIMVQHMHGLRDGSVAERLNMPTIRGLPVFTPPLHVQSSIAHILGTLDEKVELNRRMNITLEQMARALFKSWFVDFDPIKAKAQGRPPEGVDADIASIFPSDFEECELETIPRGWELVSLDQLFDVIGGGTPKTSNPNFWNGDVPWFSVSDAPAESDVFVIDTEKKITQLGLSSSSARMLRKGVTIISARGTVGKLAVVATPMAMNQSCYALDGKYGDFFTYYSANEAVTTLKQNTHGAVFDTITRDTFKTAKAILPTSSLCQAFEDIVLPLMRRIEANLRQSRLLEEIRDSLLPKLISGQLRIPDVEASGTF